MCGLPSDSSELLFSSDVPEENPGTWMVNERLPWQPELGCVFSKQKWRTNSESCELLTLPIKRLLERTWTRTTRAQEPSRFCWKTSRCLSQHLLSAWQSITVPCKPLYFDVVFSVILMGSGLCWFSEVWFWYFWRFCRHQTQRAEESCCLLEVRGQLEVYCSVDSQRFSLRSPAAPSEDIQNIQDFPDCWFNWSQEFWLDLTGSEGFL